MLRVGGRVQSAKVTEFSKPLNRGFLTERSFFKQTLLLYLTMDSVSKLAVLNAEEIRVLGSLIEKSKTTPEYYPMSLNGLTAACNQKTSRKPVVNYSEETVIYAMGA